jgi:TolA-binding protein
MISYLFSVEPSAFDAGRLDTNIPYGLTESEKQLLNTNNKLQDVTKDVGNLKNQVGRLIEQQEGATSVLDSVTSKIAQINRALQSSENNLSIEQLKSDLKNLQDYVQESRELEIANQENVKKVLQEVTAMIDKTNSNYLSLEKRVADIEGKKTSAQQSTATGNSAFKSISADNLLKEGERLFEAKDYNKSKPYFQELSLRNHRPARSSFVLGEIAYFNENWNEAIVQYKKSAELYDKAAYTPKLLYHTAISFDKIKDTASANQFYKLLKSSYPDTVEAKASPSR